MGAFFKLATVGLKTIQPNGFTPKASSLEGYQFYCSVLPWLDMEILQLGLSLWVLKSLTLHSDPVPPFVCKKVSVSKRYKCPLFRRFWEIKVGNKQIFDLT